jgi:hypothetical protein
MRTRKSAIAKTAIATNHGVEQCVSCGEMGASILPKIRSKPTGKVRPECKKSLFQFIRVLGISERCRGEASQDWEDGEESSGLFLISREFFLRERQQRQNHERQTYPQSIVSHTSHRYLHVVALRPRRRSALHFTLLQSTFHQPNKRAQNRKTSPVPSMAGRSLSHACGLAQYQTKSFSNRILREIMCFGGFSLLSDLSSWSCGAAD